MDDSEKPFACPSPGCNMSFANEDHLVVHRKKHDMILNLGNNGKSTFVADQTPTPTRFIRNCEEVGLFQDLQNVNPFEETFRRAVEDGKTGALSESEGGGIDDTLHTPHIFPNIAESSVIVLDADDVTRETKETSSATSSNNEITQKLVNAERSESPEIIVESQESEVSSRIVVQEADTSVASKIIENARCATNLSINGQEVQLLLKTADGKLMQLSAVPMSEKRNEIFRIDGIEARSVVAKAEESLGDVKKIVSNSSGSGSNRLTLAKMRLRQTLTKNNSSSGHATTFDNSSMELEPKNEINRIKSSSSSEQRRKQDVLARNRASSMRAREKRKAWIQQLQRTAGSANERNMALQLEVKALRCEVARLRGLLMAHENCPVTRAMDKGSHVGIQIKSSSAGLQNINSSQTNVATRLKRIIVNNNETPIAPKITKLSSNHRAAKILPKINTIARDISVGEDISRLRIVDVRTIQSENETSKKIILVENNPSRILEYSRTSMSRQTIQMNPTTLRIDNAASKCTGT